MKIEYAINKKSKKSSAHLFVNGDTMCKMYSTGGLKKERMGIFGSPGNRMICTMCSGLFRRLVNNEIQAERKAIPRIYLDCPYEDKDIARSLGARWDAEVKKWYIMNGQSTRPFSRWMPSQQMELA